MAGLEPVTSAVTGQRSNQLSYTPAQAEEKLRKTLCSRQRVNRNRSQAARSSQRQLPIYSCHRSPMSDKLPLS